MGEQARDTAPFPGTEDQTWHHWVGVVEKTNAAEYTVRLYRDGVEAASILAGGPIPAPPGCRFFIGNFVFNE